MLRRLLPEPGPVRVLAAVTLINTCGRGVFFTLSALYFTRILGFSVVQVGAGLSIAAAVGLTAGIPVGHLGDRKGLKQVMVVLMVLQTIVSGLLLVVADYWQFLLVASMVTLVDRGASAVRGGMIAGVVTGPTRARTRAYLRSVTNVGMTVGMALAAIALHFDTRAAYLSVLYFDVATYAVCVVLLTRLPHVRPTPAAEGTSMFAALRDLPFVAVMLVGAVLSMHYWIVEIAMPLWVVDHTDAPRWLVAVLAVLNCVTVVSFQVYVARRVSTVRSAVRGVLLSGVLFVIACGVFGVSGSATAVGASLLLGLAALLHVTGELFQASASFVFGFDLAPDNAQGQYQGLYGMGHALAAMLAPTVMALLPLGMGVPGWWILAGILLAASLATKPVVAWAVRTRDVSPDVRSATPATPQ